MSHFNKTCQEGYEPSRAAAAFAVMHAWRSGMSKEQQQDLIEDWEPEPLGEKRAPSILLANRVDLLCGLLPQQSRPPFRAALQALQCRERLAGLWQHEPRP
jgi:hypothetical protein